MLILTHRNELCSSPISMLQPYWAPWFIMNVADQFLLTVCLVFSMPGFPFLHISVWLVSLLHSGLSSKITSSDKIFQMTPIYNCPSNTPSLLLHLFTYLHNTHYSLKLHCLSHFFGIIYVLHQNVHKAAWSASFPLSHCLKLLLEHSRHSIKIDWIHSWIA